MNKTDEELNLAEAMAKRYGVRMCDENGDAHGEELYCVGIDDIADIIREALADHSGDSNEMVADTNPLSVFAKECVLGAYTYDELPDAARLALKRAKKAEPVKQEPVAVVEITYGREPECYVTGSIDDFPEGVFKLYAAPVQQVDLTDDEIREMFNGYVAPETLLMFRAVIAADRELNK